MTIFVMYGEFWSGVIPVSSLVAMLEEVGVPGGAARATISRLKRRGELISVKDASGHAAYTLAPSTPNLFSATNPRIFAPTRSGPNDPWAIVIFSVPEEHRADRYAVKRELAQLGGGFAGGGVAVAPEHVLEEALVRLESLDLLDYVECFDGARYRDRADVRDRVAEWWDLEELDQLFGEFFDEYRYQARKWPKKTASAEEIEREAFTRYVPMLTKWRTFPYRDPNLPLEFLPKGWKAPKAKRVFLRLNEAWAEPARRYAQTLAGRD